MNYLNFKVYLSVRSPGKKKVDKQERETERCFFFMDIYVMHINRYVVHILDLFLCFAVFYLKKKQELFNSI